ncbi:FAD binding domain protein [Punctularia strigosozonata HHB-11173 SS5]|uniref:FAD binding domain protein n=1 Tax=Punctularia strigosozonata (strain HHB-11173) TaxID=741275 RepID=R7S270_PUNST|nr:FAD binding domain protein [Punctularia strigosozonata HHB-11173 SS5]EIN04500.1 FAD binding domain protein [Punctularia strigosozonata HHB-11173 SS5]
MSAMSAIYLHLRKDQILTPEDGEAYESSLRRWAENAEKRAKFVVFPESASDVSKAILYATRNALDIAIKGGGHSCSGASSSEGLVIDLARLNSVRVDEGPCRIVVGGGAVWADVDAEAAKYNLATVGGTVNHTGKRSVGGLTLGGGYGWLTAKYGLTIDNLEEVEVVLANGEVVTANESRHSDLFWAVRGAGTNYGVVTYFTLRAYPQTNPIWSGLLVFPPTALSALFGAAQNWARAAGENESAMIFMACPPPEFKPCLVVIPFYNGSADEGKDKFKVFYDVGPVADMTQEMPYSSLNAVQNPMATHGDRKLFKSTAFASLEPSRFQHLFDEYAKLTTSHPEAGASALIVELHPFEKVVSVPNSATSFANRGRWYNINLAMRWKTAALDSFMRAWSGEQVAYLENNDDNTDFAGARGYSNYGLGDERVRDVFGENYDRLAQLKAKYDPDNVFHKWFPVAPKA